MRRGGILLTSSLAGAVLIVAACSSDDADSPAGTDDGGLDATTSSSGDARTGSPSDSGIVAYDVVELPPPMEGDCDQLTDDDGLVTFTEPSDDLMVASKQVHSSSVGGLVEENQASPFIHGDVSGGPSTDFSVRIRAKLTAGMTYPLVKSSTWFYGAHEEVGQATAEYYEIAADFHSRAWVSTGGGTVTVVCLKNANAATNDATYILKIEGAKFGLPDQPDGSAPVTYKGSFTANGVFRHVAKK